MRRLKKKGGAGRGADRTGRSCRDAKHVRLYGFELESSAYQSLSPGGRALLIEFRWRYNGDTNRIHMSVRSAAKALGVGKDTARRAIAELLDRGFIRLLRKGRFTVREGPRDASEYALTNERIGDEAAPKDFMRWRPQNHGAVPETRPDRTRNVTVEPETAPRIAPTVPQTRRSRPKSFEQPYLRRDTYSLPSQVALAEHARLSRDRCRARMAARVKGMLEKRASASIRRMPA